MKKLLSMLVVASMVAVMLTGCSGNKEKGLSKEESKTETTSQSGSDNKAKEEVKKETGKVVTLRIWGGVPPESGPQASIDLFNEAFKDKGIQAEYERFVNDDTGNMKLETSLLGGGDIDLYMSYSTAQLTKRAQGNLALDLSDLIARDGFTLENYLGDMVKAYYVDGKAYCVPTKLDQYGMVLNKDMFDAAEIQIPTEWTYEEFREIAKKLTHGEGTEKVYGVFWNSQQDLAQYPGFFISQTVGGDFLYNKDGKSTAFDGDVFKKTIELINNTMNVDHSAPTHIESVTQKLSQESMFLSGKCAMCIGPWIVRSIKDTETYPHDFVTAFAPYPVAEEGSRNYTQGGYGDFLCINPNSEHIDAAWEYLKWYASEGMLPLTKGGRIPAFNTYNTDEVTEAFLNGTEELLDAESSKTVLITPHDNYAVPSITTKIAEITKVLSEELESIYSCNKDLDTGLLDAKARGDDLLK